MHIFKWSATFIMLLGVVAPAHAVCPMQEATVFYVNGVDGTRIKARQSRRGIERELGASANPECVKFDIAYNKSAGIFIDFLESALQVAEEQNIALPDFWRTVFRIGNSFTFTDELLNILFGREGVLSEEEKAQVDEHVLQYLRELNQGRRVVIVGHSQGNLFANAGWNKLEELGLNGQNERVRLVAVATPADKVEGGGPHTTLIEDTIARVIFPPTHLAAETPILNFCGDAYICHGFLATYLNDLNSKTEIVQNVKDALPTDIAPSIGTGFIQGGITDERATPIEGATIRAISNDAIPGVEVDVVMSDENGFYRFIDLAPDVYKIIAEHEGNEEQAFINLAANEIENRSFIFPAISTSVDIPPTPIVTTNSPQAPRIAAQGNNVYVAFAGFDGVTPQGMYIQRSTNNGASFGNEIRLSDVNFTSSLVDVVAGNGVAHAVWAESAAPGMQDVFYSQLVNGDTEPSNRENLSDSDIPFSGGPVIAVRGDSIAVAWLETTPITNLRRILVSISLDGGSRGTFTAPIEVTSRDSATAAGFLPSVAIDAGNNVSVIWMQRILGNNQVEVRYSRLDAGTTTFTDSMAISSPLPVSTGTGIRGSLAVEDDGTVHVAWVGTDFRVQYVRAVNGVFTGMTVIGSLASRNVSVSHNDTSLDIVWININNTLSHIRSPDSGDSFTSPTVISPVLTSSVVTGTDVATDSFGNTHIVWGFRLRTQIEYTRLTGE